jgi:hypothetical protein
MVAAIVKAATTHKNLILSLGPRAAGPAAPETAAAPDSAWKEHDLSQRLARLGLQAPVPRLGRFPGQLPAPYTNAQFCEPADVSSRRISGSARGDKLGKTAWCT